MQMRYIKPAVNICIYKFCCFVLLIPLFIQFNCLLAKILGGQFCRNQRIYLPSNPLISNNRFYKNNSLDQPALVTYEEVYQSQNKKFSVILGFLISTDRRTPDLGFYGILLDDKPIKLKSVCLHSLWSIFSEPHYFHRIFIRYK